MTQILTKKYPVPKIDAAFVLGAGHGARLQSLGQFKPWVEIAGQPLILHVLDRIAPLNVPTLMILNSAQKDINLVPYPAFKNPNLSLEWMETPSSMHTLDEAQRAFKEAFKFKPNKVLVTLVDPILRHSDWLGFLSHAHTLGPGQSSVLTSRFVDDEKPLYAWVENTRVIKFTKDAPPQNPQVTAGIYVLDQATFPLLDERIQAGDHHLRNFLQRMIDAEHEVFSYCVDKTIDIDRPEDVETANRFLSEK